MTTETTNKRIIDATGKRLGKVATEAAVIMMGKDQPNFAKHIIADVEVEITNVSKLDIPEGKKGEIYQSYSGYPGGRKTETLIHLAERRGYDEVVRRTVGGMLPDNKHKKRLLAKLVITE
ncbi:uL13 family ribosomal protein [Candidatus Nomurabacteria bacterium]|nr:uL13 family ribosomal protein [Candidatus Kaiserbacteria bacterium]MCB9813956.1 uL13 family ribosomal protein [Candidatus Nomurabacteria bacterium]